MAQRMVALLRGINVGRNKRVQMADLRRVLADLGYGDIRTHLNSGNAVFSCPPAAVAGAAERIQAAIAAELGVECAVMTRTRAELDRVLADNPLADVATDPARFLVGFLSAPIRPAAARTVTEADYGADRIRIVGSHAYLWCPTGINDSPVTKLAWSKQLGVSVTTRNWTTVGKLAELAAGAG
jgi:uncharacterized protein (DUF1697 family)